MVVQSDGKSWSHFLGFQQQQLDPLTLSKLQGAEVNSSPADWLTLVLLGGDVMCIFNKTCPKVLYEISHEWTIKGGRRPSSS